MTRQELETWLCGDGTRVPTFAEVATLLGTTPDRVAGPALPPQARGLAGLRFTIAVLRDVFGDDAHVRHWLRAPRPELGGRTCVELLRAGQTRAVEELAIHEWHAPSGAMVLAPTVYRASIA